MIPILGDKGVLKDLAAVMKHAADLFLKGQEFVSKDDVLADGRAIGAVVEGILDAYTEDPDRRAILLHDDNRPALTACEVMDEVWDGYGSAFKNGFVFGNDTLGAVAFDYLLARNSPLNVVAGRDVPAVMEAIRGLVENGQAVGPDDRIEDGRRLVKVVPPLAAAIARGEGGDLPGAAMDAIQFLANCWSPWREHYKPVAPSEVLDDHTSMTLESLSAEYAGTRAQLGV